MADFATTQWSLVLRAGQRADAAAARALELLCERYWLPIYAYVRRQTPDAADAQDLTQEFFARLIEKNVVAAAEPERGRFRAFLLGSVKHFLSNARDRARAQKRGGDRRRLSLDFAEGESRLAREPAGHLTPERLFERRWALELLEVVVERLRAEHAAAGKLRQFELLSGALAGDRERLSYAEIAAALGQSEEAARQAASRLRRRYRELLRAEVAATVVGPEEVDDELRRLLTVLGD